MLEPAAVVERMRQDSAKGREHALQEGLAIAREMLATVRPHVQGVQVSAPFGKVAFALEVFTDVEGIDATPAVEVFDPSEHFGFAPPAMGRLPSS